MQPSRKLIMKLQRQKLAIRNLASPYGLAIASYLIFLVGWLFPPSIYTNYIHEPDLMYLDPLTLAYYTICVLTFMLGVRASSYIPVSTTQPYPFRSTPSLFYFLTPVFLGSVFTLLYLNKLGGKIDFVSLLASQQGQTIKLAMHSGTVQEGRWAVSVIILSGILWWALYRARQFKLQGSKRNIFYLVFGCSVAINVATCVAAVDRTDLMPLLAGLFVIALYFILRVANVKPFQIFMTGFLSVGGLVAAFVALSFLRGGNKSHTLLASVMGYTIVSYNRLAALLAGTMHYVYGGSGAYLVAYLVETKTLDSIFHFHQNLGWPSQSILWDSEFGSTMAAGLNPVYIWSGLFGYLYSDLAWGALLYVVILGIIVGFVWSRFKAGKTMGLVLYPWMAFCILFWVGSNIIFNGGFAVLVELTILLTMYDSVMLPRPFRARDSHLLPGDLEYATATGYRRTSELV